MSQIQPSTSTKHSGHSEIDQFRGFLTDNLQTSDFEVLALAGDASSRRYYRVVVGESSRVLMAWEPFENPDQFPFLNVQRLLASSHVQVPEVIAYDEHKGLILLEDLGDLTLERKFWENQDQSLAVPFYKQALDELLHINFSTLKIKMESPAFKMKFDTEKLMWEMNYAIEHMLLKFCKVRSPDSLIDKLRDELKLLCQTLAGEASVVCHRDYHSRNVMLKFGKMRVIDFQDARMGPMQYDLVSLFKDSYVNLDSQRQAELLKYYLDEAEARLQTPINLSHFMEIYEQQTIQRCFKACGSFTSFYNSRQDLRYLKYIDKTIKEVYKSLLLFPQYKTLLKIIHEEGLLERNYEQP